MRRENRYRGTCHSLCFVGATSALLVLTACNGSSAAPKNALPASSATVLSPEATRTSVPAVETSPANPNAVGLPQTMPSACALLSPTLAQQLLPGAMRAD